MRMDGSVVLLGDTVYDVTFGAGVVTEVQESEKRCVVQFGELRYSYTADGRGNFPMRTLYWRNPIVGVPPKDQSSWELFRRLSQAVGKIVLGG